jgi:hypothetical protein
MTRSQWAGLFAAGLIGFAQYSVEHSHYAETDMAALLTLALALWLWVMTDDTVRLRWFIAAALVSGFAAGTKFTLVALGPVVLVEAILLAGRRLPRNRWKGSIGLLVLGILLFGAGFVIANPVVWLDFDWFWAGLAAEKRRVFAETALNLGPLSAEPTVRYLHHFWSLCAYLKTLGYPWLILIAGGLFCVVSAFSRRYWTVFLLFPIIYAVYWIFMAPWVRSQEFLLFLPSFSALAIIPLIILWSTGKYLLRFFTIVLAILAIGVNGYNGLRASSLFGWKDTRLAASEWLQIRLPPGSALAAELYAEAACVDTSWKRPLPINKIERCGLAPLVDWGAEYLLRTSGVTGRGLRNPLTGELYPEPAELFQQFLAGSELLCAWAPLPPTGLATFASPAIELYGLKHFSPVITLRSALSQPALIVNTAQNLAGRQTFFPTGHNLGCAICLLVDRLPQTVAIGGPQPLSQPVFLVLNTDERPATINVRGFGMDKKIALDPYDTAVVPLKRPKWSPGAKPFEMVTLKAEPVEDVLYIPCFARIVFTADEAMRIFMETAREDRIKRYFSEEWLEKNLNPDTQYILATRLGLWPLADRSVSGAADIRARIDKCLRAEPASVSINGNSGYYYEQFARARFLQLSELSFQLSQEQKTDGRQSQPVPGQTYRHTLDIPILIAGGKYELRGKLMLVWQEHAPNPSVPLVIQPVREGVAIGAASRLEFQPGKWQGFSLTLQPQREIQPQIDFQSPLAAQFCLSDVELCWSLSNILESVQADLTLADIRHNLYQAKWENTAGRLAALLSESRMIQKAEFRQMMFTCAGGLQDNLKKRQVAQYLLQLAPRHYLSLQSLAVEDETARATMRQLESNLKAPFLFPPWLALVGFSFNTGTREVRCVFEALANETPPLAAVFWLKRRGDWRRKQVQSLTNGTWLNKGERVAITVCLNDAFGQDLDLNKLALGIETDVLWHAGAIPLATGGYTVPFSCLGK